MNEKQRLYHRPHTLHVSAVDTLDTVGYVNKNKTRNCVLDAIEKYDASKSKIFVRLDPGLKTIFQDFCNERNISMNEEIVSLIEADICSF